MSAMKKVRKAYELDKKKWFTDHEPKSVQWGYGLLG